MPKQEGRRGPLRSVPKSVWLIYQEPRMDCSDTVIVGPLKSVEEAESLLKSKSIDLAHGTRSFDTAEATILVGDAHKVEVQIHADGKRTLRRI